MYYEWAETWPAKIHEAEHAKKRIASAKDSKTTPSRVDKEKGTAVFRGSGKTPYETSLTGCTCVDFAKNRLPCKHMYRLAMELGLMGTDEFQSKIMPEKYYSWQEVADIVEEMPEEVQKTFLELIRGLKKDETKPMRKKKNSKIDALIESGLYTTDPSKETSCFYVICLIPDYASEIYRVFQYFNRKFNPPMDMYLTLDGATYGQPKPLARDDRTDRLLDKGFAVMTPEGAFIKGYLPN